MERLDVVDGEEIDMCEWEERGEKRETSSRETQDGEKGRGDDARVQKIPHNRLGRRRSRECEQHGKKKKVHSSDERRDRDDDGEEGDLRRVDDG